MDKYPNETLEDYIARLRKTIDWHRKMISNREREIRKIEKEKGLRHEIHQEVKGGKENGKHTNTNTEHRNSKR